jgi:hypothetical protein
VPSEPTPSPPETDTTVLSSPVASETDGVESAQATAGHFFTQRRLPSPSGVLQPSPLKEISTQDYEGREVIVKHRMVIEPLLGSQRHKGRHDHFFNSRVGKMPTIGQELLYRNNLRCVIDEQWVYEVTYETIRTKINDIQDPRSALGLSKRHTDRLKPQRTSLG